MVENFPNFLIQSSMINCANLFKDGTKHSLVKIQGYSDLKYKKGEGG